MRHAFHVFAGAAALAVLLGAGHLAWAQRKQPAKRASPATDSRAAAEEGMINLQGHGDGITALAFSADGKLLASGSGDRTIIIWDPHSGKLLHRLEGHSAAITALSFSPDGRYLLSAAAEPLIDVWDTATWKIDSVYEEHGYVGTASFLADSQGFVTSNYDHLTLWEVHRDAPLARTAVKARVAAVSVVDGDILYGDHAGTIGVWNGNDSPFSDVHSRPIASLDKTAAGGNGNFIVAIGQGPPGHALICDRDGLWDWDRAADRLSFVARNVWGSPGMLDKNKYLVAAYQRDLWLREADPQGVSILFKTGFAVHAVAVSPAGDLWAYGGRGQWTANMEWERGYASEVRLLKVPALDHAFEIARAAKGAGRDVTTVKDPGAISPGWDQPADKP